MHVTPIYAEGDYEGVLEKLQAMTLSNDLPNISQAGHHYAYFMTENIPVVYAQDFIDEDGSRIRKDENYEENYLLGKYGAIPSLKTIDFLQEG